MRMRRSSLKKPINIEEEGRESWGEVDVGAINCGADFVILSNSEAVRRILKQSEAFCGLSLHGRDCGMGLRWARAILRDL